MDPLEKVGLTPQDINIRPKEYDKRVMHAYSPGEGRYAESTDGLREITSEFQWVKRRLGLETEYIIGLSDEFGQYNGSGKKLIEGPFTEKQRKALRKVYENFSDRDYMAFKRIEKETDHDIVAMNILGLHKMGEIIPPEVMERAMHFGRTSSDIDSNTFSLMNKDILEDFYLPKIIALQEMFIDKAYDWHKVPEGYERPFTVIAGQTHEQFAVPTPIKKVMANYAYAIDQAISKLIVNDYKFKLDGKLGGAVGNDSAMIAAYPDHNWERFYENFITDLGLNYQISADQDESNMKFFELIDIYKQANIPLLKWCNDYSSYLSRKVLMKKTRKSNRGSSIMPQKVNPWRTEGGEAALTIADAELEALKLMGKQRKQGDLRRSFLKRYVGVSMGNIGIALDRIKGDLKPSYVNFEGVDKELTEHPEISAASMQMIMRADGVSGAYDLIVEKTKGKTLTPENMDGILIDLVGEGTIESSTAERISNVFRPENNVGNAFEKTDKQLSHASDTVARLRTIYDI